MATVHCPSCDASVTVPDIGPHEPPGLEVHCSCGADLGIRYPKGVAALVRWRPNRPITVRKL